MVLFYSCENKNEATVLKQIADLPKELKEIFNQNSDHLATKSDIREVKMELKGEIHLLRWMIGFVMAAIVASLIQHNFIH